MRLYESLLNENKMYDNFPSIMDDIKKDCSQILKIYSKTSLNMLFRGISYTDSDFQFIIPRQNRRPLSTPQKIHDLLDDLFKKEFGWNVRSEGVFAVPSKKDANIYGTAGMFFPVDGFKYVWSKTINDLYVDRIAKMYEIGKVYPIWLEQYGPDSNSGGNWMINSWFISGDDDMPSIFDDDSIGREIAAKLPEKIGSLSDIKYNGRPVHILPINYSTPEYGDSINAKIQVTDKGITLTVHYYWLPKVDISDFRKDIRDGKTDYAKDTIKKFIKEYIDNHIEYAKSENEIMFKCDCYYWIHYSYEDDVKFYIKSML